MKIKKSILEYLIRECAREVLTQVNKLNEAEDDTKGAPAPPESGQGTADQPEIPKVDDTRPEEPSEPETPPPSPELKGLVFVNPRNKARLQKIIPGKNEAELERSLYKIGTNVLGMQRGKGLKISLETKRMARDVLTNPNSTVYLYIGKLDPSSDELFLMADRSLQVAKDQSVPPTEFGGTSGQIGFDPISASPDEYASYLAQQGQTPRQDTLPDEEPELMGTPTWDRDSLRENLRRSIRKIVAETLDSKK